MKRKVLCVFSLIAYLLVFCTIFSGWSQREMSLLVTTMQIDGSSNHNYNLSIYYYQWGETEGLFHVVEGSGWDSGNRVAEISPKYYVENTGYFKDITLHPGTPYTLIKSATRTPQVGDLVQIVTPEESRNEKLIVYMPEGNVQTVPLPNNFTIMQQGEKGIFLDTISIGMPFFEHYNLQSLASRFSGVGMRVYSYSEAESLLRQLPLIALAAGLLLAGVILWAGTFRLTRKRSAPGLVLVNICLVGLSFVLMLLLTRVIDLPASFMPQNSILDFGHYRREFSNIFTAAASFGDHSLQDLCKNMQILSAAIVLGVAVLGVVILLVERIFCKKRKD